VLRRSAAGRPLGGIHAASGCGTSGGVPPTRRRRASAGRRDRSVTSVAVAERPIGIHAFVAVGFAACTFQKHACAGGRIGTPPAPAGGVLSGN